MLLRISLVPYSRRTDPSGACVPAISGSVTWPRGACTLAIATKEVDDGIIRLATSDPRDEIVSEVNCFLLEQFPGKCIMVDAGWARSR